MNVIKYYLLLGFLCLSATGLSQTVKQFNGNLDIILINSKGNLEYDINGLFSDPSNSFSSTEARQGDVIIDVNGSAYKILNLSSNGTQINTRVKAFNSVPPFMGMGVIYRPTTSGFPLISVNTAPNVLTAALNTATINIDANMASFASGSGLPTRSGSIGDVVSFENALYKLTVSGWAIIPLGGVPIDPSFPVTSASPGTKGDVIRSMWDNKYYFYDGSSWVSPPVVSVLSASAKFGDVFYVTSEKKLYMMDDEGSWNNISSSSIPGGTENDIPDTNEPGDLFFNTDKNILYVYDVHGKWVEVSTNGSSPSGIINPDPALENVKPGNLFYNTSTNRLHVYNGTAWTPLDNVLPEGLVYVGNKANIATPVKMSGDATIATNGILAIAEKAITDKKLDKENIPLSGFGLPLDHISLGDEYNRFKITNLDNPTLGTDAATKNYVDALFGNASLMLGLPTGQFFVGNLAGKAEATAKTLIPLSGFGAPKAPVNFGNVKITNLADPTVANDAATKNYVDSRIIDPKNIRLTRHSFFIGSDINTASEIAKDQIPLSGFGLPLDNLSLGDAIKKFKITNLADPMDAQDAATKNYVDSKVIVAGNISLSQDHFFKGNALGKAEEVAKNTIPISGFGKATASINMGDLYSINNMADPLFRQDAATKNYVDNLFSNPSMLLALPKDHLFIGNDQGKASAITKKDISISDFGRAKASIHMGDVFTLNNLADPLFRQDAATKNYVDTKIANPSSITLSEGAILVGNAANQAEEILKEAVPFSDFGAATKEIELGNGTNNYRIVNLADPIGDQDAATKAYVDGKAPDTPSGATFPANPKAGDVFFNTTEQNLYIYDGKEWIPVGNDQAGNPIINLPKGQFYIGDDNDKATAIAKDKIPLSGFGPAEASVSLGDGTNNFSIINLADPKGNQDAATKAYVDSKIAETPTGDTLPLNPNVGDVFYNTTDKTLYVFDGTDWSAIGSGSNGGGGTIIDLPKGMFYIGNADNKAIPIDKKDIQLSGFGSAQDTLIMGNYRITKLANPIYPEDAATKAYVDSKTTKAGNAIPAAPKPGDTFFNTDDKRLYFYNGTDWVSLDNTLLHDQFYIGDAKNRAISIEKGLIPISGFGAATAHISLGNGTTNYKITDLGIPTDEFDAVPKGYVDNILDGVTNGYMERAIYDSNNDNIVDVAATVNGFTVEMNVPSSAVFTDELVKVGANGTPLYLSENDFEVNASATEIVLKKLDFSKFDKIANNTLLGNNLGADASPIALSAGEIRSILELDKVDNTADEDKRVFSASRIYPPININGKEFDGSSDIDLGDNLGNHTATENIKTGAFSISNDGGAGKGLSFDLAGNASYEQDVTVNGNFYTPSDQRLKTNIETLTEALESLDKLQGVRFEYIDQKKYMMGSKIGLIAQELQKVYPEMVSQGSDGFLKVDYTQLSAVLIQAVKEQQQQIKVQAQEIEELKRRMDKQQDQLDSILKTLAQ